MFRNDSMTHVWKKMFMVSYHSMILHTVLQTSSWLHESFVLLLCISYDHWSWSIFRSWIPTCSVSTSLQLVLFIYHNDIISPGESDKEAEVKESELQPGTSLYVYHDSIFLKLLNSETCKSRKIVFTIYRNIKPQPIILPGVRLWYIKEKSNVELPI